jgi:hypothetical protein
LQQNLSVTHELAAELEVELAEPESGLEFMANAALKFSHLNLKFNFLNLGWNSSSLRKFTHI